jgi:cyclophilin family peptidyl-prolyl cis-trans isomerase
MQRLRPTRAFFPTPPARPALAALALAALALLVGFARPAGAAPTAPPTTIKVAIVTERGTIEVALDPVHAPITVKNFLHYVDTKFYNGGTFFRAIPGFVIQGGNKSRESPSDPRIELESSLKTGLMNVDGAISMARTTDPNSATSEFFIDDGAQSELDGSMSNPGYAAFGFVTKNMALVREIARLPAEQQMLVTPVKIIKIYRIK